MWMRAALCAAFFGRVAADSATSVEWVPTILKSLGTNLPPAGDGGGNDEYFRASGMVVKDGSYWSVNGVHPVETASGQSLSDSYPKSLVKASIETDEIEETFSFSDAFDHDVDMEALTWGPDGGETYVYIGDEYNYVFQFEIASGNLTRQWNLADIDVASEVDKGIESIAYNTLTENFFVGIQGTATVHEIEINPAEDCSDACTVSEVSSFTIPESPSGMFYSTEDDLLYIMCGTETNGDQFLYVYTTDGAELCLITIPSSVGMSRTDGIFIDHAASVAYIADSQGPIHADDASVDALGYNVYQVTWDDPCGTSSGAAVSPGGAAGAPGTSPEMVAVVAAASPAGAAGTSPEVVAAASPEGAADEDTSGVHVGAFTSVASTGVLPAVVAGALAVLVLR